MTKNKIKTIVMVIAVVLVLALAGGWIAQTVVSKQNSPVLPQTEENPSGGMQLDISNATNGVKLTSALIATEDYAEYGISALSETAYSLNATVTPANAPNKNLTWALAFQNPSSSWADGKTPSDYVKLTTSGTQATLECKQAFGEPIIVTATSTVDSSKSAQCKLNYKQKITGVTFSLHNMTFNPLSGTFHYNNGLKLNECRVFPTFTETVSAEYNVAMTKSDTYTVAADALNVKFEMLPNESFINSVHDKGYEDAELLEYTVTANSDIQGVKQGYFDRAWAASIVGEPLTTELTNGLIDTFGGNVILAYTLNCYVDDMTTPVCAYPIHLDFWEVLKGYDIDAVTFDKAEIEF